MLYTCWKQVTNTNLAESNLLEMTALALLEISVGGSSQILSVKNSLFAGQIYRQFLMIPPVSVFWLQGIYPVGVNSFIHFSQFYIEGGLTLLDTNLVKFQGILLFF